jgi:hypothetical protein
LAVLSSRHGEPQSPPDAPQPGLSRRTLLRDAAVLFGSLGAGSILATLAPSRTWALELTGIDTHEGETLLRLTQTVYPHATLPSAVYALAVKDLDAAAAKDAAGKRLLRDGVATLDAHAGGNFAAAGHAQRLAIARKLEGTPFFETVRSTCITSLYNNDMAFAHFGYEGASWPKGGYIRRGFNDLTWLPSPPGNASPPVAEL